MRARDDARFSQVSLHKLVSPLQRFAQSRLKAFQVGKTRGNLGEDIALLRRLAFA